MQSYVEIDCPALDVARLQQALEHLAAREARVKTAYENGIDTLEEYGANKKRLAEERQSLQEELDRVLTPAAPPETISKEDFRKEIKNINDILKNPEEPAEKKRTSAPLHRGSYRL